MDPVIIFDPLIEDIPQKELKDFFQFWKNLVEQYEYPSREDFSPQDIMEHLSLVSMVDVEKDTNRFKVRLCGSGITERIGWEATGQFLDEMENTEDLLERYNWVVENKKPYYLYMKNYLFTESEFPVIGLLAVPFFDSEKNVNLILFRMIFEN